jgi:DNA-directed RNA polymerase subunit RPC12/RpoP
MDELKNWTKKTMLDFLRSSMEPAVIDQITTYILNIDNSDTARSELEQTLGLIQDLDNHSQSSLLTRNHKMNFIDSYIEKRFQKKPENKRRKEVKVDFNKKNIEKIAKELQGPAFGQKKICYCMAREHELVGNCLACGKIVCAIEGRGPCMFCGHQVLVKGQMPSSLPDKSSLIQAIKHKDKLIDYDRNTEERLAVIDDQNDWFDISNNTWLSHEDREKAANMLSEQEKRVEEAKRLISLSVNLSNASVSVDVGSKRLLEETHKENKEQAQKFFTSASKAISASRDLTDSNKKLLDQIIENLPKCSLARPRANCFSVVQNEDPFAQLKEAEVRPVRFDPLVFAESEDKRMCMTMHQPWASLVILGFKRFEGREWQTDFRGPLWIHAGGKKVTAEEIEVVENKYRELFRRTGRKAPEFPSVYPTGVLIGRVELTDVVSNEKYLEMVEEEQREESTSKFLFVVKNPSKLLIPIRMDGSKKLYPIEFSTWEGAKNGLRRVPTDW